VRAWKARPRSASLVVDEVLSLQLLGFVPDRLLPRKNLCSRLEQALGKQRLVRQHQGGEIAEGAGSALADLRSHEAEGIGPNSRHVAGIVARQAECGFVGGRQRESPGRRSSPRTGGPSSVRASPPVRSPPSGHDLRHEWCSAGRPATVAGRPKLTRAVASRGGQAGPPSPEERSFRSLNVLCKIELLTFTYTRG
jgi:hypothetical protein